MINKKILEEINKLRIDNVSGANEFINKALEVLNYQLYLIKDQNKDLSSLILELSREIISSRPSMAPLINIIGFLIHNLEDITKKSLLSRIEQLKIKRGMIFNDLRSNFNSFLNNIREEPISIMLISYSSTIIRLLNNYENKNLQLYILESRPLFEGRRVAETLSQKFETHLIIDAAMGKFMEKVDIALIGVDSILRDGSVINKVGTYPLAVLAKSLNKQVCAICDSFKYNLWSHYGIEVNIEEKNIKEVYNKERNHGSFNVHNYYFDITPAKFIDKIISDLGILSIEDFLREIEKNLPISWFKQFI